MIGKDRNLYFEEIGKSFDDWISSYDVDRRALLIKSLLPHNSKKMTCLEIGSGTGRISEKIQSEFFQVIVSDISEKLAKQTGQRLGLPWKCLNATAIDLPNESVDIIVSSECIEHLPSPEKGLSEMARVIKKGGYLVVTSPNKLWFPLIWLTMKLKIRDFHGIENWLFPGRAKTILRSQGITKIKLSGCHLFPWQVPFGKKALPFFDRFGRFLYPLMINYGIVGKKI